MFSSINDRVTNDDLFNNKRDKLQDLTVEEMSHRMSMNGKRTIIVR